MSSLIDRIVNIEDSPMISGCAIYSVQEEIACHASSSACHWQADSEAYTADGKMEVPFIFVIKNSRCEVIQDVFLLLDYRVQYAYISATFEKPKIFGA
jgi:hypothetical protein